MKYRLYKIFITLVAITYVFSTIGISVISHYCGGELEGVSFFTKPDSCCGGDEEDMEEGCCTNKVNHVVFQKDFTYYHLVSDCKIPVLQLSIFDFQCLFFNDRIITSSIFSFQKEYPPPNLVQQDIVSVSVLRI